MRIAIQGEPGSFHDHAAHIWQKNATIVPAETFRDVFVALHEQQADQAIVAIENSLYGSINEVLDLIEQNRIPIVGEIHLPIHQNLITLPGTLPSDIKTIYSHPVALAQCEAYLDTHFPNAKRIEQHDTAGSVRIMKEQNDKTIAAIAGEAAAQLYDTPILQRAIEDNTENYTRFVVINPHATPNAHATKASLTLVTSHAPGALAHVLSIFAQAGCNLTKLQSRPLPGNPWNYRFYIDIEVAGEPLYALLAHIRQTGAVVDILGEYSAAAH